MLRSLGSRGIGYSLLEPDLTRVGGSDPGDQVKRRGFARPGGAEDHHELFFLKFKAHMIDSGRFAVALLTFSNRKGTILTLHRAERKTSDQVPLNRQSQEHDR